MASQTPNTPLLRRMFNGAPLLVRLLASPECTREMPIRDVDPNVSGPSGKTPLYYDMHHSTTALAELLLAHGAKVEPALCFVTVDRHRTAGKLTTKSLLDKGLDPNITSESWGTPLQLAVFAGNPSIVKLTLDAGGDSAVQ
ncbi:hypothetical protein BKA65DRAFT_556745 [Rhexocercosporidium sp. MPI-PUGE-AT-0058]|nr:hypothetical protein BKA65DRAFT_556745 [Rhexocercosporidium sp. MPI-PUGE-AT-0058]